jgi:lactate permease
VWTQRFDPTGSLLLSALAASLPIAVLLWALVIRGVKGHVAGALTVTLALVVAVGVYRMPPHLALMAAVHGALYGLFPISWIVIAAVFLYQITVRTGQFDVIKQSVVSLTDDRRIQALLIAFCFGAFLEGAAGFGAPVAISAGMLVGLGFPALEAAGLCLIANTAPVAFGSIGIPIIVASQVTGIDAFALSQMVGRQLPLLSLIVPAYLVVLMDGWRGLRAVWPAVAVCGGVFAATQFLTSNLLGPMLPDILSSIASIAALVALLAVWRPEPPPGERGGVRPRAPRTLTSAALFKAWAPFLLLTVMVSTWGVRPVQILLDRLSLRLPVPWLHNALINPDTGARIAAMYRVNWLAAAGTAVVIAALFSALLLRMRPREVAAAAGATLTQLKWPIATIASFLAFAYVGSASGMTTTLGRTLASTGSFFPFFSPILGWLGVFITGSDTSANALFGTLQQVSATQLGLSPVLTVAANSSGGVTGKMISPQSIAVACAAAGMVGHESTLLRFTLKHSIAMVLVIAVLTWLQATWLSWMVPAANLVTGPR